MLTIVNKLSQNHTLLPEEFLALIENNSQPLRDMLAREAQRVALHQFGNNIYTRGLIEISNYCKNNCYYCGIRAGNKNITRFRLTKEQIMECCAQGRDLGFRTFVLQGGEDPFFSVEVIEDIVSAIRKEYPECAITLSLGEWDREAYQRFYDAGADRYLLRHETYNASHYATLHPQNMSCQNRLRCLEDIKQIGFQAGTGIMVGAPNQTAQDLLQDILFIERFQPEMIGIGPFLPQHDTPFANEEKGSLTLTLLLISIFRLMFPKANIPATTSLATIDPQGREMGILAGANVVMPNLSPKALRPLYALYDNKVATNEEAAESREKLRARMQTIGYNLSDQRGDYGDSNPDIHS